MEEIVFWKNHPAVHDHQFYKEMSSFYRVFLICDNPTPQSRILSSGWSSETGVETIFLNEQPSPSKFVSQFVAEHSQSIHAFCGLRSTRSVRLAMSLIFKFPSPRVIISQEAPTKTTGLHRVFQYVLYRFLLARYQKKISAFFTMGKMGIEAYQHLGFPAQKLYSTMYSYPGNYPPLPSPQKTTFPLKVIYVGAAIPAKGVPLLLNAVKKFTADSIELTFVGSDPDGILARVQNDPLWKDRIRILGVIPNKKILDIISQHDLLILPSFNDGWGMVVTEALIAGIGAIVTDACGSQDIPRQFKTGLIIRAKSESAIVEALKKVINEPQLVFSWKVNARACRDQTRPEQIAKSMHKILSSVFQPLPKV